MSDNKPNAVGHQPWKVLIVDDDPDIHAVTELALNGTEFSGQPLHVMSAFSGRESVELVRRDPDIALILMDVMMETETAGLDAVEAIRNDVDNWDVRIVLRTGQAARVPERQAVTRYDINDYREKTELTATKLFTVVHTGIKLFREIRTLRRAHAQLSTVNGLMRELLNRRSLVALSAQSLDQMQKLYRTYDTRGGEAADYSGVVVSRALEARAQVLTGSGMYADLADVPVADTPMAGVFDGLQVGEVKAQPRAITVLLSDVQDGIGLHLEAAAELQHPISDVLTLFVSSLGMAFNNTDLIEDVAVAQSDMVLLLSEAIEQRSQETGNHVRRVGEASALLAELAGLPSHEVELLRAAAPLHDVGKIAIPDAILNKPGRHTREERAIMQTHAAIGQQLLARHDRPVLRAAAIVAGQHHERWDGLGYPLQLAGDQIHIYGRIAALIDVFDALCSERVYKQAWPMDEVLDLLRTERGRYFDPTLIDLFVDNLDAFLAIRAEYPD